MLNTDLQIYNRKTGLYETEKIAGSRALKYIYGSGLGRIGLELLIKRKIYSYLTGVVCDTGLSRRMIEKFILDYDINMDECCEQISHFSSFNSFFARKLKPQARVFSNNANELSSPGDGRLRAWTNIDINKLVQIKNMTYSLKELINNEDLALEYNKGTCIILRLAPVDYHRFHFVDSGICSETKKIKGKYYSVNPLALNAITKILCQNKREYSIFNSDNFGEILYVEIGATSVGSIVQTYEPESRVSKGQEKGFFKFGGSTIVLFLKKGSVTIDKEILVQTEKGYETKVYAGETIGKTSKQ